MGDFYGVQGSRDWVLPQNRNNLMFGISVNHICGKEVGQRDVEAANIKAGAVTHFVGYD